MEDSFYWPLPFITEPNREYVIAAVNFYYQRQDLDWLIFVCCQGLESFANTRWKAVMIAYKVFCYWKLGFSPLTIDYFPATLVGHSVGEEEDETDRRQQQVMRLIFSNGLFVAARQQDSDHNDSLGNRFL